jgi:hypothetical protein
MLLDQVVNIEAQMARFGANSGARVEKPESAPPPGTASVDIEQVTAATDPSSYLQEALRVPLEGEKRLQAELIRIDCNAKGIVFTLREGEKLLKLSAADFKGMDISTYTTDVSGEITCGPRKVENSVVVTYRPAKGAAKGGGEIVALEFVPKNFKLQ